MLSIVCCYLNYAYSEFKNLIVRDVSTVIYNKPMIYLTTLKGGSYLTGLLYKLQVEGET